MAGKKLAGIEGLAGKKMAGKKLAGNEGLAGKRMAGRIMPGTYYEKVLRTIRPGSSEKWWDKIMVRNMFLLGDKFVPGTN